MKITCLLFLMLIPANLELEASPLPWGEGVPRPASSSAGAGRAFARRSAIGTQGVLPATARLPSRELREARKRVRGLSGPKSEKVSPHRLPPTNQRSSAVGNAAKAHQPHTNNSVGAVKSGVVGSASVRNARASSVTRIVAPTINNVRHRSPNPAVVGGSAKTQASGAGSLNGTRMNRRP